MVSFNPDWSAFDDKELFPLTGKRFQKSQGIAPEMQALKASAGETRNRLRNLTSDAELVWEAKFKEEQSKELADPSVAPEEHEPEISATSNWEDEVEDDLLYAGNDSLPMGVDHLFRKIQRERKLRIDSEKSRR